MSFVRAFAISFAALLPFAGGRGGEAGDAGGLPAALRSALLESEVFEVVSLDPEIQREFGYGDERDLPDPLARWLVSYREGHGVYGSARVRDVAERTAIVDGLAQGLTPSPPAGCYDPRHAILARRGDQVVAIQLCFACHFALILEPTTKQAKLVSFQDAAGLRARLNRLLGEAGVPLAPAPGEAAPAAPLAPAPEKLTVYGVDPDAYRQVGHGDAPAKGTLLDAALAELQSGRGVTGKAEVTRPGARARLLALLVKGLATPGDPAECYNPRHALVFESGGKREVALLCFECSYARLASEPAEAGLSGFGEPGGFQAWLDWILETSPLSEPAHELVLEAMGPNKIGAVKVARQLSGKGLADSQALVEQAPSVIQARVGKAEAEAGVASFAAEGSRAVARPVAGTVARRAPRHELFVLSLGANPDAAVAALAEATGRPLADLKQDLARPPASALRGARRHVVEAGLDALTAAGAKAEIRPSGR